MRLIGHAYRQIASHLPEAQCSAVMRSLSKAHDLLLLEGMRQGVAAAAISNMSRQIDGAGLEHLKAFQLHAHIYGSQDTPLNQIEVEWTEKFGMTTEAPGMAAWLDQEPMRFAPMVEAAFEGRAPQSPLQSPPQSHAPAEDVAPGFDEDHSVESIEDLLDDKTDAQERPDMLDRVRDELMSWAKTGVKPRDWQDMILRLHLSLQMDAAMLDIQLGTDMGRNVLAQAGFHDMMPGAFGVNLGQIEEDAKGI